jgi:hypothetical protein
MQPLRTAVSMRNVAENIFAENAAARVPSASAHSSLF